MHPAFSVIYFTVFSGTGYGLLVLLGVGVASGWLPADPWFGLTGIAVALVTVSGGLLSSTLHLGRPERAWRAVSQWRSSWLSREAVVALALYPPALGLAYAWFIGHQAMAVLGWVCAGLAAATVFSTAMIYRSLKTIPQWRSPWTPPAYLLMGLAGGSLWLTVLVRAFGYSPADLPVLTAGLVLAAWAVKLLYWRGIDGGDANSGPGVATGLDALGTVRAFEAPHTSANFLLKEMGYQIARKHAAKLRRHAQLLAFLVPLGLIAVGAASGGLGLTVAVVAAVANLVGLLIERWLFFAEARHVVAGYYRAVPAET